LCALSKNMVKQALRCIEDGGVSEGHLWKEGIRSRICSSPHDDSIDAAGQVRLLPSMIPTKINQSSGVLDVIGARHI
jgi:hypothetical protein